MRRRVLITGANGYLGRALVGRALADGDTHVHAVWHAGSDRLAKNPPSELVYQQADLGDPAAIAQLFAGASFDAIIHAAALLPDNRPNYLARGISANVLAAGQLAESAAEAGVGRFVYCSSISVYGRATQGISGWTEDGPVVPTSIYGWSKHAGEECVRIASQATQMGAVFVRLAGIHGGDRRSGALFHLTSAALEGRPLALSDPSARFQFVFIADAAEALWQAAMSDLPSPIAVNVASVVYPSLIALAVAVLESTGSRSPIHHGAAGAGIGDVMDTTRMRTVLGYDPPSVDLRLREYCERLAAWQS